MLPYLHVFNRAIPMYGVMILLGVAVSLLYFKLCEKKREFPQADAELALVYCVVGIFIGAKILWLITVWSEFTTELPYLFTMPQAFLTKYMSGGFVFYGGLYGALIAAWLYCRVNKLSFFELARILMPMVPLFHCFGRLGCFFMGCCYGCMSERFGITFHHSEIAPNGIPLLPVQLIEAVFELLLFFIMAWLARRKGSGKILFCVWMITYGVLRFCLEYFRADDYRGFLGILSVSQGISVLSIVLAFVILWKSGKLRISTMNPN